MAQEIDLERLLSQIVTVLQAAIDEAKAIPSLANTLGTSTLLPSDVRDGESAIGEVVSLLKEKGYLRMTYDFDIARPLNVIIPEILALIIVKTTKPTAVGELPHQLFLTGSGLHTFNIAIGFAGEDLVYTIVSASADAEITLDPLTGTMTVKSDKPSKGDVIVRATNRGGFVQQTFPLFVNEVEVYTVLARNDNGTVTLESVAPTSKFILERQSDGTVIVEEAA